MNIVNRTLTSNVVFIPVVETEVETVMVMGNAVFHPNFVASSEEPFFGVFGQWVSSGTMDLTFKQNTKRSLTGYFPNSFVPLSDEILQAEQEFRGDDVDLEIDFMEFPRLNILPVDVDFELIYEETLIANNGEINFTFTAYGGNDRRNRITFFINHEPIQINGYDFIEIDLPVGEMFQMDIIVDVLGLIRYNIIYAIMAPTGYDGPFQEVTKTPNLLLINK